MEKKDLTPTEKWILEEMIRNGGTMTEEELWINYQKYFPSHGPAPVAN